MPLRSACNCISVELAAAPPSADRTPVSPGDLAYRDQEVVDLEGNGLERGAGHVLQLGTQGQAGQQPRGARIPPGGAQPVEAGDEVNPVRGRVRRERRELGGRGRCQLREPGQGRAAGPDVAFDGAHGFQPELPGDRLAQPGGRVGPPAGNRHDGRSGPVGGLHQAVAPARMAEQRGVRVTHDGQDRHAGREQRLVAVTRAEGAGRSGRCPGGRGAGTPNRSRSSADHWHVPMSISCVREALPTSIWCWPVSWCTSHASTVPRHRSPRAACARSGSTWSSSHRAFVAENIGSRGSPLLRRTEAAARRVLAAQVGGALVLPADQRGPGLPGPAVPDQQGLPLGAQAEAGELARVRAPQAGPDRYLEAVPELGRGLFHPAAVRVVHGQAGGPPGHHVAGPVDQYGLRRARALVDGQEKRFSAAA